MERKNKIIISCFILAFVAGLVLIFCSTYLGIYQSDKTILILDSWEPNLELYVFPEAIINFRVAGAIISIFAGLGILIFGFRMIKKQ